MLQITRSEPSITVSLAPFSAGFPPQGVHWVHGAHGVPRFPSRVSQNLPVEMMEPLLPSHSYMYFSQWGFFLKQPGSIQPLFISYHLQKQRQGVNSHLFIK